MDSDRLLMEELQYTDIVSLSRDEKIALLWKMEQAVTRIKRPVEAAGVLVSEYDGLYGLPQFSCSLRQQLIWVLSGKEKFHRYVAYVQSLHDADLQRLNQAFAQLLNFSQLPNHQDIIEGEENSEKTYDVDTEEMG